MATPARLPGGSSRRRGARGARSEPIPYRLAAATRLEPDPGDPRAAGDRLEVVPRLGRDLPVGLGVTALAVAQHPDQVGESGQHRDRGERDLDAEDALLGPVDVVE